MKPFIASPIPRQRRERHPVQKTAPDNDPWAVTLDRLIEYRLVLPMVVDGLWGRLLQEESEMNERRAWMAQRIKFIEAFQRDVNDAPYDETRSIDLTHDEADLAAHALVETVGSDLRPGEGRVRTQLSAGLYQCLGRTARLQQHDAVARTTNEQQSETD